MDKKGYYQYDLCKSCGGKCCTHHAGMYIPNDFKEEITVKFIVDKLQSGKFALDWWEGDVMGKDKYSRTLYLRPRHVGERAIEGSWGGVCVNWLEEKGCSLSEQERPYQCRVLIPKEEKGELTCDFNDDDEGDKKGCAKRWYDFQEILEQSIDKFKELNTTEA